MHPHIQSVRLVPPRVPYACRTCSDKGAANRFIAKYWLVAPDGSAVSTVCQEHGKSAKDEFKKKLGETWALHNIHHQNYVDNTSHERGPICGHSQCSQNFIETGQQDCIIDDEDPKDPKYEPLIGDGT